MYLKQVKQFNERLYSIVCLISFTFYYRVVVKRMTRQYAVSLLLLFDDSLIKDHSRQRSDLAPFISIVLCIGAMFESDIIFGCALRSR